MTRNAQVARCPWAKNDLANRYHDQEWGVPQRDGRVLFEFLILEGAQAGLSWDTILAKRENYREAFDGFDAERIARYTPARVEKLLANPGIVRNRLKVESTIINARAALALREAKASSHAEPMAPLSDLLWSFVDHTPRVNRWTQHSDIPATTPESDAMSKALKKLGFKFVGSTICYALMQATGMVNDHLVTCPRHAQIARSTSKRSSC